MYSDFSPVPSSFMKWVNGGGVKLQIVADCFLSGAKSTDSSLSTSLVGTYLLDTSGHALGNGYGLYLLVPFCGFTGYGTGCCDRHTYNLGIVKNGARVSDSCLHS